MRCLVAIGSTVQGLLRVHLLDISRMHFLLIFRSMRVCSVYEGYLLVGDVLSSTLWISYGKNPTSLRLGSRIGYTGWIMGACDGTVATKVAREDLSHLA